MSKICKRKSDGALFVNSYPAKWNGGDAIAAAIKGPFFYFRGIEKMPKRWKCTPQRYRYTGEIWQFHEYGLFDIVGNAPSFIHPR